MSTHLELALAKRAAEVASKSLMRQQIGAVVATTSGRIVATGFNRMRWWAPGNVGNVTRSSLVPPEPLRSYSIHAEEDAIRKTLSKHWATQGEKSLALYVGRLGATEPEWGLSAPCEGCERLIYEASSFAPPVTKVWYSSGEGNEIVLAEVVEK